MTTLYKFILFIYSKMSGCCGQGVTNLMSQFKTASTSFTTTQKYHPHDFAATTSTITATTTQTTPQNFTSNFTASGFMKFSRPSQQ